jgi:hypothetical protein
VPAQTDARNIAVLLTDDTDWEKIRELVTDSYRILAPKKLTAPLDSLHGQWSSACPRSLAHNARRRRRRTRPIGAAVQADSGVRPLAR